MTTQLQRTDRLATAHRNTTLLSGVYFGISLVMIAAIAVLHNNTAAVTPAVWGRCGALAVVSALTLYLATRIAKGSHSAYLRLRIVTAIQVVAIAIIVAIPGAFPMWVRIEQGLCGLVLIGIVAVANSAVMRNAFARK